MSEAYDARLSPPGTTSPGQGARHGSPGPPQHLPQPAGPGPYGVASPSLAPRAQGLPPGVHAASPWLRFGSYLLEGLLAAVTLYVGWIIWALIIGGEGQTPAKKLLGMRVIGADSLRPVGLGRMFWVRGLLGGLVASFAIVLTLGVLLFMPFWDKRNQNLWDKVSNTYVVTDPQNAWGRKPDLRR